MFNSLLNIGQNNDLFSICNDTGKLQLIVIMPYKV